MRLLSSFKHFYYSFDIPVGFLLPFSGCQFFSNPHISAKICKNSADLHISAKICKNPADLNRFAKIENLGMYLKYALPFTSLKTGTEKVGVKRSTQKTDKKNIMKQRKLNQLNSTQIYENKLNFLVYFQLNIFFSYLLK